MAAQTVMMWIVILLVLALIGTLVYVYISNKDGFRGGGGHGGGRGGWGGGGRRWGGGGRTWGGGGYWGGYGVPVYIDSKSCADICVDEHNRCVSLGHKEEVCSEQRNKCLDAC